MRTIPAAAPPGPLGEDELFRRDYAEAQDAPTLADYLAVPAEDFGAACLRGMGLAGHGDDPRRRRRPRTRSGASRARSSGGRRCWASGAEPSAALGVEIGEWGGKRKGKGAKVEAFNPLVLQNKKTGETLTGAGTEGQDRRAKVRFQGTVVGALRLSVDELRL